MNFVRQFLKRVSQIPSWFKKVYVETKQVNSLNSKKKFLRLKNLSRNEEELIRTNRLALSKLVTFFFAQLVPIIGYIPLFVYFSYPRQLLTPHFWSDEEKSSFPVVVYTECRVHADELAKLLKSQDAITLKSSLDTLSKPHLKCLAGANGICSSQTALKLAPAFLLRRWLASRSRELVLDDTLLQIEGVDNLDTIELLQNACLRRGLSPCISSQKNVDVLKEQLQRWIETPVVRACQDEAPASSALLMHVTALPQLYKDEKFRRLLNDDATTDLKKD